MCDEFIVLHLQTYLDEKAIPVVQITVFFIGMNFILWILSTFKCKWIIHLTEKSPKGIVHKNELHFLQFHQGHIYAKNMDKIAHSCFMEV